MHILQVSTGDLGGGAERIAADLHRTYRARGLGSWLAVGRRSGDLDNTVLIPGTEPSAPRGAAGRMALRARRALADPTYIADRLRGLEDMSFPGTRKLLGLVPDAPDVLHLHNLHGDYFDLRVLPRLAAAVPTLVTLHDTWLCAGHCAYAMRCERWRTGCGHCPDLARPVPLARDSSAANWKRKHDILRRSRLTVVGPSRWVLEHAEESIVGPAIVEGLVIPNGIDTSVYTPGDRTAARGALGITDDAFVIVFSALAADSSPYKDLDTIRRAMRELPAVAGGRPLRLFALGASGVASIEAERTTLVPFEPDPRRVAQYLRAADIYVHMAHAETFGLSIVEAQACGVPVVASAVGGIPETIEDGVTGVLVPEGDADALAAAILELSGNPERLEAMGAAATRFAHGHFALELMADRYLETYARMVGGGR